MSPPLISVIMSVYNGERFLCEALESILSQSFENFELIVSNNGSTDGSKDIIENYQKIDKRIILFDHENLGFSNSLNQAINLAKTNIIARMDADDVMGLNRLREQYDFLLSNKEVSLISCLAYYINDRGETIGKTYSDLESVVINQEYFSKNEPIGILHPGAMYYKNVFIQVGGYREEFFPAEDIDLWNRFNDYGYWAVVQQRILMKYRMSSDSEITKKFMLARQKFEWCRECMRLRRSGNPEISWEYFINNQENLPIMTKINKHRKNYAKFYYRNAGFEYASNNFIIFFIKLISALFLQPNYVIKKLIKQKL